MDEASTEEDEAAQELRTKQQLQRGMAITASMATGNAQAADAASTTLAAPSHFHSCGPLNVQDARLAGKQAPHALLLLLQQLINQACQQVQPTAHAAHPDDSAPRTAAGLAAPHHDQPLPSAASLVPEEQRAQTVLGPLLNVNAWAQGNSREGQAAPPDGTASMPSEPAGSSRPPAATLPVQAHRSSDNSSRGFDAGRASGHSGSPGTARTPDSSSPSSEDCCMRTARSTPPPCR